VHPHQHEHPHPKGRFARISHKAHDRVTTTFLAAEPGYVPDTSNHAVLADVAKTDPARAARIQEGLRRLVASDDAVMAWLEADPAHAALLASDPRAALRQALPDLPADFFDGWTA